ncbi:S-adenosylmethionine sensor upstream of mTORC1 [Pelobates fuscus]|uniref:S-adenosylmethionine sensor upstream of mTORC1 n=1 Tax=Pelobates fuscus TaxID=191477 RepID=UPI002FE48596
MAFSSSQGRDMERRQESRAGPRALAGNPQLCEGAVPRVAKQEQEKLSGVVKSVHRSLRKQYLEDGNFDKVWNQHCKDERKLGEYACAMKSLADNYWTKKCEGQSRIEWCLGVCRDYFFNGGKRKIIEKDARRAVLNSTFPLNYDEVLMSLNQNKEFHHSGKMRLLDVGSCYNPFLKYEDILAVGIDIVPAVETVHRCDFLNLQIRQPLQLAPEAVDIFLKNLRSPIESLHSELFDVVVFSLLLSYFPSRYQRWLCCKKAHELLALNGLLLIITPDSSHQNRHALMMKSWKIAIESLGFKRMIYSKFAHMHLMAFRKTSLKTTCDLITRNYPDMLYIPQDFNFMSEKGYSRTSYVRSERENEQLACTFSELPGGPFESDSRAGQTSTKSFYEFEEPILLMN